MYKSTAVVADRLLCDGKDVGDYVKVTLPELKWKTTTLTGAGLMGDVDIPIQGMAEAMSAQVDLRNIGKENAPLLLTPGVKKLELRFNRDAVSSDGTTIKAGTKIYISGMSTGISPGAVARASTMDGNATLSVFRYRWVEDGQEIFLLDQINEVYKVGGKDYSDAYRL